MQFHGLHGSNLFTYIKEQWRRGKADARTIKRVAQAFAPYKFRAVLVLLAILLVTGLDAINLLMIQRVWDDGIVKRNFTWLLIDVSIMIIIPIVSGISEVWQTYLSNIIGQNVMRDFRNRLYQHLQSMSLRFFTATQTGEIQSRLFNDVNGVQSEVTMTATVAVSNMAAVISTVIAMFVLSPLLTGVTLGLLPIFVWMITREGKLRRTVSKETQQSMARLSAIMQETLSVSGILLMKTFGRQAYAQRVFQTENQRLTDLDIRQQMIGRWLLMLVGVFFCITSPIVYLTAGWQMMSGSGPSLTFGTIIAFTTLQMHLLYPLQLLLNIQVDVQGALALFDRIFEYLDMPVEIQDAPHAISLAPKKMRGRLTFKHVTFTYKRDVPDVLYDLGEENEKNGENDPVEGKSSLSLPPLARSAVEQHSESGESLEEVKSHSALKNVSFEILPGQLAALVGPSGAGKTTMTYLVPRLYDVDSGSVEIDGHNVKDVTLASLSEVIGMVTQETYLFHASVRENLLYARQNATEEEMMAATKAAAIHDRITELENGYDTVVGERGYRLSGGEKQRIAIARVILKNPRILILDEATSALDTHSEQLIQAALEPLMKGRTTLAIAHRLSTILAADVILVVNKGEIVERGTHQQLLALGGLYAQLYHEQFGQAFQKATGGRLIKKAREENQREPYLPRPISGEKSRGDKVPLGSTSDRPPIPTFLGPLGAHFERLNHLRYNLSIDNEIYKYRYNIRKLTSDKNREISEYLIDNQNFFALRALNKYKYITYNYRQQEAIQELLKSLNQFAFKALEILPSSGPEGPSELHPLLENLKAAVRGLKKEMEETTINMDLGNRRPDYAYS